MAITTKLTDTQLVILSQAAQRPDRQILPLPPNLQAKGGGVTRAVAALLKGDLIAEQPASSSDEEWRRDENDTPSTLVITPAGLSTIGIVRNDHVPPGPDPDAPGPGQTLANGVECPPAAGHAGSAIADLSEMRGGRPIPDRRTMDSKGDLIQTLLKRESGATLAELTAATGWQVHSVRGFLSGTLKKKLGYTVASARGSDGVRRYRIDA